MITSESGGWWMRARSGATRGARTHGHVYVAARAEFASPARGVADVPGTAALSAASAWSLELAIGSREPSVRADRHLFTKVQTFR